jgi:hypothetical protein
MELLATAGRFEPSGPLDLQPTSASRATRWWIVRLNQMVARLSDPATFGDSDGYYSAHEHQHWMLTLGQAFGLMTSLQASGRDRAAQLALMFTLLDTFADPLTGGSFEDFCTLRVAWKTGANVRRLLPWSAAAILVPAADRAIQA